jgi:hypothetical protein
LIAFARGLAASSTGSIAIEEECEVAEKRKAVVGEDTHSGVGERLAVTDALNVRSTNPKKAGKKNSAPMVSKYTAPGLRALLAAVDMSLVNGNKLAERGLRFVVATVEYLDGPAYAAKSAKQSATSRRWRAARKSASLKSKE